MSKKKLFENGIAIVGFSGRFPGADSCSEFWENLRAGKESVTFFDDEALIKEGIPKELLTDPNYVKASPILNNVTEFDANYYNFSPREAIALDPQQRIFLEICTEALELSGYFGNNNPTVGVYAGSGDVISNYLLSYLKCYPEIEQRSGSFQHLANDKDYLATRVSYKLDLRGPSISVQTACSTSLVAVHLACQAILDGECDMALAGGVNVRVPQHQGYYRQEGDIFSSDGHVRTFDEKADGVLFGSGAGVVVLKSLEQAVADNDLIYAYIRGTAVNNDGGSKLSYTASSYMGQIDCIEQAILLAEIPPESLQYIEAHGTATRMGDAVELAALSHVLGKVSQDKNFCGIGSVKTNVGHLDAAAGVTGLIKSVLMLHHEYMPASINYTKPSARLKLEPSPFYVVSSGRAWTQGAAPRRCGINSLGIGGTNAFVVLEEAPTPNPRDESIHLPKEYVFVLSAKSPYSLNQLIARYKDYLMNTNDLLADICYTAAIGRRHFQYRVALIVASKEDLLKQLTSPALKMHEVSLSAEVVSGNDLRELSLAYSSGKSITWADYYAPYDTALRKVGLPTYAFERQRYWLEAIQSGPQVQHDDNPFLLRETDLPEEHRYLFEAEISNTWPEFIPDHMIYGQFVVAGATYLSAMMSVIERLHETRQARLKRIEIIQPVVLSNQCSDTRTIRISVNEQDAFKISSFVDRHDIYLAHVQGEYVLDEGNLPVMGESLESIQGRCRDVYTNAEHAKRTSGLSYELGPHFSWIEQVNYNEHELLAKMRLPAKSESKHYVLYPGFIDACFQTMLVWLSPDADVLSIPIAIDSFHYNLSGLSKPEYVYIRLPESVHSSRTNECPSG